MRGFVVTNLVVLATKTLEHLRGVQITCERTSRTCEGSVSLIDLAQPAVRETEVVENAFVCRRQLRCPLQAVDSRSIVASLIVRAIKVVQCLGILLKFPCAIDSVLLSFDET